MVKQRKTVGNLAIDGDLTYEILLCCGAMSKAWRRITTNPTFLSDHAHHRPLDALLYNSFGKVAGKIDMELDTLSVAVHHHATVPERRCLASYPRLTNHMVAFDMVAETFKQMMPPLVTTKFFANLLAMDKFLMASKFTDLGMDLWVLEGYGVMDERWEFWHHVVLPWQLSATLKRPLLTEGGDSGDVIMGTTYDLGCTM
uniref:F-box associated domain-containing protein n=1 Tax=Oryza barthii TaxID=65489 RepID=A0A0D3GUQ3_9ORYZ